MRRMAGRQLGFGAAVLFSACALTSGAQAEDFFSTLFGGFGGRVSAPPPMAMPFTSDGPTPYDSAPRGEAPRPRVGYGGGQAWCVRSCDGRYFPVTGSDNQSRVAACNSFCPAAETKLVYGGSIDNAATSAGEPYSELPNAFRYRQEIVAGCTCNGKDQFGLAPVGIENDPTLRKGDIVAGTDGLMVANRAGSKSAAMNFSPISDRMRERFQHLRVVARE